MIKTKEIAYEMTASDLHNFKSLALMSQRKYYRDEAILKIKDGRYVKYTTSFEKYGSVESLKKECDDFLNVYTDAKYDVETYYEYGDQYVAFTVTGWRAMTKEEMAEFAIFKKDYHAREEVKVSKIKEDRLAQARKILEEAGEL